MAGVSSEYVRTTWALELLETSMVHLTVCPEPTCGAPAEQIDRFTLPSTDGPIEFVRTYCAGRHIFMLPEASIRTTSLVPTLLHRDAR